MARTLDPALYSIKREAFVDAGLRLMQAQGYEQMSIQDVLDAVQASRGAFYHYFDSKQALLEAMVDRIAEGAIAAIAPVVEDPSLAAGVKLERFFGGIAQFKTERKALMLEFVKVWKSDENAVVREHLRSKIVERIAPILARIIRQGIAEEVFDVDSADEAATALMVLLTGFQDRATDLFLARQANAITFEQARRTLLGFTGVFERILGARPGSIQIVDQKTLIEWFG